MNKRVFMSGALVVAGLAVSSTTSWAAGARVCFEAEAAASMSGTLQKKLPGPSKSYSGRGYLAIPWDKNKTKGEGQAYYRINVAQAGTYYMWARTYWQHGCGNSIGISVNGGPSATLGEDGTYNRWHWVGGRARVQLKKGLNTFLIQNRETGVRVDQVFLTTDRGYTPTGIRKIES